ncbi:MAG: hypothetical protein IJS13_04335 [Paludibacteraceae bacterium]|nr:hypothetical protein [Paludibacteraceae bacterium]
MKTADTRSYPLLPYSQLVWDLMQSDPHIYNFDFTLRVKNATADIEKLKQAFRTALSNHPVLSMVIDADGKQSYMPTEDILHGQFHSIRFEDNDNYTDINVHYNRILGDSVSGNIFVEDVFRAYNSLALEQDHYIDYLEWLEKYKQSSAYSQHRQWLEKEFGVACPVHPQPDLPLTAGVKAIEGVIHDDFTTLRERLQAVSERHIVSLSALFSLAAAMAIMQYNGTDMAALTWAYEGREQPMEQHVFGSLHRDIPILLKADTDKTALFKQIRTQMRQGIAHSLYPYTLTKPFTERWNYAVNVLYYNSNNDFLSIAPFEAELIIPDTEHPAYSLLDMEIYDSGDTLALLYRYSATHYNEQSMMRFAGLVRQNLEWLTE